mmetsp:Transcript_23944/g.53273  ORF Transcript_23944/g.53273 Transcript_23944/m.53273 type:complete len:210 (-) Transcript_23944:112-741(-)
MMDDLLEKYLIVATKVFVNVVRPPAILSGGGRKQEIFGGCLHKGDGTARRRGRRVGGKKKGIDDDGLGIGCFVFFQQRSDKHTGPPTDIENATTAARGVCRFQLQPITDEINQILHVFTRFEKVGIIVGFCLCMGFVMGRDRFCCHGSFLLLLLLFRRSFERLVSLAVSTTGAYPSASHRSFQNKRRSKSSASVIPVVRLETSIVSKYV